MNLHYINSSTILPPYPFYSRLEFLHPALLLVLIVLSFVIKLHIFLFSPNVSFNNNNFLVYLYFVTNNFLLSIYLAYNTLLFIYSYQVTYNTLLSFYFVATHNNYTFFFLISILTSLSFRIKIHPPQSVLFVTINNPRQSFVSRHSHLTHILTFVTITFLQRVLILIHVYKCLIHYYNY